jgi:erythromycin esterase-like protein
MRAKTILKSRTLTLLLAAACGDGGSGGSASPTAPPGTASPASSSADVAAIKAAARPVTGTATDYTDVMAAVGDSTRILLGESTHGTHEYYRERARLSERLIRENGVNAIAIEGDWTPTFRVNLYVRGLGTDRTADEALQGYTRFPRWMWGNTDFRDFVERLRTYNLALPAAERVGLYGLDVYDLSEATDTVVAHLRLTDPARARRAQAQYRCFSRYGEDLHAYGAATRDPRRSCREEAGAVLAEVRRLPKPTDPGQAETHFGAVRSAASVVAAEEYFRITYTGSLSWNARDKRMAENVEEIAAHAASLTGRPGKVVTWSHNTHAGDARATSAANRGELDLGQLMRQRHGHAAFLIGFFTYTGTVMAADEWDQPGRVFDVRPALEASYSGLFHKTGMANFSLLMRGNEAVTRVLGGQMLERAIGVIYRPQTERQSHYFEARLSQQFDAAIFFARTKAVTAIRR